MKRANTRRSTEPVTPAEAQRQITTSWPWLPLVPADWLQLALARVTLERCDGPFGSSIKSEHYADEGIRVVRLQNIGMATYKGQDSAFLDEAHVRDEIGYAHDVLPDDLLIAGLGDENNPLGRACVAPSDLGPTIVKADCYRFRLDTSKVEPAFVALQLSALAQAECGFIATGSTRQRLNLGLAAARRLVLPPTLDQQRQVVAWLDRETARINELIEKKTRFIELLREKRQALITQAVTQGLDPAVPMKDSGVEWLGQVPAHWAVCKLSYRYQVELGKMLDEKRITGEHSVPYLRNQDVQWSAINAEDLPVMDIAPHEIDRYTVRQGDLLVCEGGDIGRSAIWCAANNTVGYQKALHRLRPRDQSRDTAAFFLYVMIAAKNRGVFDESDAKATISHLPAEKFRMHAFAFPPRDEQASIAASIQAHSICIERLVDVAKRSIQLLKERRAALITVAVTGQIDLREVA